MSTLCTVTGEYADRTYGLVDYHEPCRFEGEKDHALLHSLQADIDTAHACTRPLLGFIRRRGHIRFVILPEGSPLKHDYKRSGFHFSTVALDADAMNRDNIEKTTERLKELGVNRIKELRIARISNLEWHWCADGSSITFEVDLEAA